MPVVLHMNVSIFVRLFTFNRSLHLLYTSKIKNKKIIPSCLEMFCDLHLYRRSWKNTLFVFSWSVYNNRRVQSSQRRLKTPDICSRLFETSALWQVSALNWAKTISQMLSNVL